MTSQQRAAPRRVPPRGSTGEGEPGPPCQHLHIDSMKYDHANTHTHTHTHTHTDRHREGDILTPVSVYVGTCDLPSAL